MPNHLYGITEKTPEGENLQAQAPQAHEGESPQEAFALQVVTAPRVLLRNLALFLRDLLVCVRLGVPLHSHP